MAAITVDKLREGQAYCLGTTCNHSCLHKPIDRSREVIPYSRHQLSHTESIRKRNAYRKATPVEQLDALDETSPTKPIQHPSAPDTEVRTQHRFEQAFEFGRTGRICIYIGLSVYTRAMVKRLVDIDDDLLERARTACGERTIKATVEAGLQALADRAAGVQHIRLLRETDFDLEAFEESRGPRSA